jgi:hypothetical protein
VRLFFAWRKAMELSSVRESVINPALRLLPPDMNSHAAEVLLLTIGLQESRFEARKQIGGPARGFWQFERDGGVRGVLTHPASAPYAQSLCMGRSVLPTPDAVHLALERDDLLAAGLARLLLWTDAQPLPPAGAAADSWLYYLRVWRPGKPRRETWDLLYAKAMDEIRQ